jgi:hypothetical protein
MCGVRWVTRECFMADSNVRVIGYQADFEELQAGFFLFNHMVKGCGTTMAIAAGTFFDLYTGPVFEEHLRGAAECPRLCLRVEALEPCPLKCECRYVRDVLQVVKSWPKSVQQVSA